MDDTLQNLENELKRLPARKPSARLMAELQRELGPITPVVAATPVIRTPRVRSWNWAVWSLFGTAAAAMAIMAVVQAKREVTVPTETVASASANILPALPTAMTVNRYDPVKATSVLYDLNEEGVTMLPDRSEGRQLRYRFVDTFTWKNSTTNASVQWTVPRDEVRLVRANLD